MKKFYFLIIVALILGLVLTGCLLSNVGQVPTTDQSGISYLTKGSSSSPVGLWHLDEGTGTTAYDSSGNPNDGTLTEATYAGSTNAMFGDALSFDGINDYVDFGSDTSLELTDEFTIELWVKRTDKTTFERFLSHSIDASTYAYEVGVDYLNPDQWRLRLNSDDVTLKVAMTGQAGEWIHVAFVYDQNLTEDNMKIYENGALVASCDYNKLLTNHGILRTNRQVKNDGWLKSTIDEVRIWDTATPSFNLNVEPKLDFNPVGTDHTVTATVTIDKVGGGTEPAPGVLVDFIVSGVNGDTDSVYTDSNGQATFTYTGDGGAGIDTIMAFLNYPFYQATPDSVEKYWLENYVTGGGKINMSTLELNGGKKAALTFGGTIGVIDDASIVGQFQIVDHTGFIRKGAVSWHCNNGFSFLNFEGSPAESPEATHDTAIFEGEFVSNLGDMETLRLKIIDNGEPGARVDTFSIFLFDTWVGWTIDGGNFQVHDIED